MTNFSNEESAPDVVSLPPAPKPAGPLPIIEPTQQTGGYGRGVLRPEADATDPLPTEEKPNEPEIELVKADGQPYTPAVRDVSTHPAKKLLIEVDETTGKPVTQDEPQFADQFLNSAFAKTWEAEPFQAGVYDLSNENDLQTYNELLRLREPVGAPRVQIATEERKYDEVRGTWKVFLMFRRIRYRKVVN